MMNQKLLPTAAFLTLLAGAMPATVLAVDVPLDTTDPTNGLTEIYSATFDPALDPGCGAGRLTPDECTFFGGQTPATREITIDPNPTTVDNGAPRGITPQPPDGSFLDVDLGAGNTQVTLNTGVVYIESLDIVISAGTANETVVNAFDIGIELKNFAPLTAPIDGNGVAEFEIDTAPTISADFSTFTVIVDLPDDCSGSLCALIPILTLDMIRFRLILDYDPTFGSFTADFKGQTANNSIVFATLNSVVPTPEIDVTDSVAPADDLAIPYGSVQVGNTSDETVTVTNIGAANLVVGAVSSPALPFSIVPGTDNCSGQTVAPAGSCTITVRFTPTATGPAVPSSIDIPSNDTASGTQTVNLSGTGTPPPAPVIDVSDSVAPNDDLSVPFGNVQVGNTSNETITVRNNGNADLNVTAVTPPAAPFSIVSEDCTTGGPIAPTTGSCTIAVQFAPTGPGPATPSSIDIESNDTASGTQTVNLSGDGSAAPVPDINVLDSIAPDDDRDLPYGSVSIGAPVDETITVLNDGNADLNISGITPPALPFSIINEDCTTTTPIEPMTESCAITVRFQPTANGPVNSSVVIAHDDTDENPTTVTVSGAGFTPAPEINVTDSVAPVDDLSIPFGTLTLGMMSTETVTVTNDGTANLVLGMIGQDQALAPPFTIDNDTCSGQTLTPATNCTFEVTFAPGAAGTDNDSVDIPSNDTDEPSVVVNVSGTGSGQLQPNIDVTDSIPPTDDRALTFGDVWEAFTFDGTVTVTNEGSGDLVVGTIADPADPFVVISDMCSGQTLPASMSCDIVIRFTATALTSFNDSIDIPSNDPDEATVTVSLSGTGVPPQVGEKLSTEPSGSNGGFFGAAVDLPTIVALLLLIGLTRTRRERAALRRR